MIFKYQNPKINAIIALIFVYAPPHERDKENFLWEFTKHITEINLPCIVLGVLNEIQCAEEKKGSVLPNFNRFKRHFEVKNDRELLDIPVGKIIHILIILGNDLTEQWSIHTF